MTERTIPDFNIDQIARSGQCFRFRPMGEGHYALGRGRPLYRDQPAGADGAL